MRTIIDTRIALSILLLYGTIPPSTSLSVHSLTIRKTNPYANTSRSASVSALYNEEGNGSKNENTISMTSLGDVVRTVKVAYIDSTDVVVVNGLGQEDVDETIVKERKKRVVVDALNNVPTYVYDVTLPIAVGQNVDMCLKQLDVNGVVSENSLDVDSLKYISAEKDVIMNKGMVRTTSIDGPDGTFQILDEERVMKGTDGIIVSSIKRGGLAWNLGIRAGDMLVATSATLGDVSYGGK